MTKSTGHNGLIFWGSPPNLTIASLIAARSTTAGTPVKSCKITLAGLNGISIWFFDYFYQLRMFSTSLDLTSNSSQFLTALSNNTLILYGSLSNLGSFNAGRLKYVNCFPPAWRVWAILWKGFGFDCEKANVLLSENLYMRYEFNK